MQVAIVEFGDRPHQPLPVRHSITPIIGYWVNFVADIVTGSALLVPEGNGIEALRRRPLPQDIFVETDVKAYENFRLLDKAEARVYKFGSLLNPDDYKLTGKVSQIHTTEDNQNWTVRIFVGSCAFDLSVEDLNGVDVAEGA